MEHVPERICLIADLSVELETHKHWICRVNISDGSEIPTLLRHDKNKIRVKKVIDKDILHIASLPLCS